MLKLAASEDTIVALATPPGRGAIALIRMSGANAFAIARRHIVPWPSTARRASLCSVVGSEGSLLDRAVVTLFESPASFTAEDTIEVACHGGTLVPSEIVAALIASGARQALPGEFTQRAVLNGKIDILQAEAIADLIDARSTAMRRTALDQLDGGLSRRLRDLRVRLIEIEAMITYEIDFPEEDEAPISRDRVNELANNIIRAMNGLIETSSIGEIIREGAVVVIAGPPNVGKSSLFNAILGRARAIVTDIPGTTRDALEAVVDTEEWPIRLVDTAGIRATNDRLEKLGIEVSERYLSNAEIVLACGEARMDLEETLAFVALRSSAVVIPVQTKVDLVSDSDKKVATAIGVSAEFGVGIPALMAAISTVLRHQHGQHGQINSDQPILTRARHREAVVAARDEVRRFVDSVQSNALPITVSAVHLRSAIGVLEELIGAVDIEEIFDQVFSSFCVGK